MDASVIAFLAFSWQSFRSLTSLFRNARPGSLTQDFLTVFYFSCASTFSLCAVRSAGLITLDWAYVGWYWAAVFGALSFLHGTGALLELTAFRRWAPHRNCLIVGSGPRAVSLYRVLQKSPTVRYHVMGFIDERGAHAVAEGPGVIGKLSDLRPILKDHAVDEVFLALPLRSCYNQIQTAIHVCEEAGVECKLSSDLFAVSLAKLQIEPSEPHSMLALKVVRHDYSARLKPPLDALGAAIGLAILGVPMLLIAAAIRLTSKGPAIFTQYRYGLNKRVFKMYKFRTMSVNAEKQQDELEALNEMRGPVFKIRNDPRVTALGRFLRRTSLDELPQLYNVLRGEMSLVGPRPLPIRDVSRFSEASLMRRFSMKPGLTCLWQISGRSETSFERWMELDLRYIDTWSLDLDLEILLKTIPVVLRGQGAV
jgi:exopolysaccharide biosynthesis polyprenyl glycosylphosphotransferase